MNVINKSALLLALASVLALAAPAAALAYYPYTYFTGTSYMTGPSYMVGGGGFQTGPIGIYSQGANYYGSGNCNQYYGCGSISYNPMTGQGGGMWAGNSTSYGGQYGYGSNGGYSNYMQYVPAQAQQYMYGYGGYGGYGY